MSAHLYMLGRIGETNVAIAAEAVEAVVRIGSVVPAPGAPACVRGLVAIRSRILTLIDSALAADEPSDGTAAFMAIVSVDGHGYALTFDAVEDVADLPAPGPIRGAIGAGWARLAPRMVDHAGQVMLVIDPAAIIAGAAGSQRLAA